MTEHEEGTAKDGRDSAEPSSLLEEWDAEATQEVAAEPKPKRTRKKAASTEAEPETVAAVAAPVEPAAEPAPKRSRKKAATQATEAPVVDPIATTEPAPVSEASPSEPNKAPRSMAEMIDGDDQDGDDVIQGAAEPELSPFERLGLSGALLKSIAAVGYEEPSPIQQMTIPVLLEGRDVIAQAQTGSGKTAAFGLPIIEGIDPRQRVVQALILCPTRELAIQVAEALHKYGRHKEVETLPIYGGQPYERQFRGLQRGPHVVVGTPGRVMDHMRRETLNLDRIKFFVLDEADEMLDMGFVEDIEWILEQIPEERQAALFSATMPPRIADLAARYLHDPARLTVPGKQMTVPETHQIFYEVPRMRKVDALTRILDAETPPVAMIFCRTKMGVDELGEALLARGYQAETLHGDLSQAQRDRVMRRFRTGQADILIATDVAARGLDITGVTHVINYDIPESAEAYVHRIGRTGRAGRKGEAITLVTPRETRWLRQIERVIKAKIEGRRLPTMADVAERRVELLKQQVLDVLADDAAYAYYTAVVDDLAEVHDASQVAAALMKLYADETGRGAPAETAADDIALISAPAPRQERFDHGPRPDRGPAPAPDGASVRLFINIGRNLAVRPQDIVGAIANEAGIPGRAIGAIDIFESYSFVDVPANVAERVIDALIRSGIKGKPVNAEIARPGDGGSGGGGNFRPERGNERDFRPGNDRGGFRGGYDRGPRPGGPSRDGGYGGNREPRRDFGNDRGPSYGNRGPQGGYERGNDRGPRYGSGDAPRQYEERGPRFDRGPRRDFDR